MTYVRVDWDNGDYQYFENDTLGYDEFRNGFLMANCFYYKRIRRLDKLPLGKICTRYKRHNKQDKDWELVQTNFF